MKKLILMLAVLASLACLVLVMRYGRAKQAADNNAQSPDAYSAAGEDINHTDDITDTDASASDEQLAIDSELLPEGGTEEPEEPENTNKIVVLDPGHGGNRTGAIYYGVMEKDAALKLANYCRAYLLNMYDGVEVYLTREEDIALDPDIKVELEKRILVAKDYGADILVSMHFNSLDRHNGQGAEIYCSRRDNITDACFELGEDVMQELMALGIKRRGVMSHKSNDMFDENGEPYDYYAINRHCATYDLPGILVEHCFMDNEEDHLFMSTDEALAELGAADARGIAKYLGLQEKSDDAE